MIELLLVAILIAVLLCSRAGKRILAWGVMIAFFLIGVAVMIALVVGVPLGAYLWGGWQGFIVVISAGIATFIVDRRKQKQT